MDPDSHYGRSAPMLQNETWKIAASAAHAAGGLLAVPCMIVVNWFYFMAKKEEAAGRKVEKVLNNDVNSSGIAVIDSSQGELSNEYMNA